MRTLCKLLTPLIVGLCQAAGAAEPKPFELGIAPYLPTATLVAAYQPLRTHLEEKLKRPVILTTAPDFITFQVRCLRKEYDMAILGPGMARFVQVEAGYQPAAVTKRNVKALVIVKRNAPFASLNDLAGRRVAMLEPMLILTQLGKELFRQAGMQPERDYHIQVVKSPSNAVHAVLQSEVDAGVTTVNLVLQLADDMKQRLRILTESREIPGLMFMLHPATRILHPKLQDILLQFERTETGRVFIETLAMDGLRTPAREEMKGLDSFLPEYRKHFQR